MRRIPRALAALLAAAAAAHGSPEPDQARRAASDRSGLWLRADMSASYDDNPHLFSPHEAELHHATDLDVFGAQQQIFDRMDSLTDTVLGWDFGLYAQGRPFSASQRAGLELEYRKYVQNRIKDHAVIRPLYRRYFGEMHYVEAHLAAKLGAFDRNYVGRILANQRFPGLHDAYSGGLALDSRWERAGGLGTRLSWEYAEERYRHEQITYRDAVIHRQGLSLSLRPWDALYVETGYRHERLWAKRTIASDRSSQEHRWTARFIATPLRRATLDLRYDGYIRTFTTSRTEAEAPDYAGRRDRGWELAVRASYDLTPAVALWAELERDEHRNNLPRTPSEELLRYKRLLYSLGVRTAWDVPVKYGAPDDPRRAQEEDRLGFWGALGMSFAYDDNVHLLSPEDLVRRRSANLTVDGPIQKQYERMLSVDDGIYRLRAGLYEQHKFFGDGYANRLGADLEYLKYFQNTIKDHPVVRAFLRQYFTSRHYVEAYSRTAVNQFDRNYLGRTETARRFPGIHDSRALGLLWDGGLGLWGWVGLGLSYEYAFDHYHEPELSYRNALMRRYGAKVSRRWTPWLYTEGGYQFEELSAWASLVHDRSHEEHQWRLSVETRPWRELEVSATYLGSFRGYTSSLGEAADPFHAGRRDFRDEFSLRGEYPLGKRFRAWTEYRRDAGRSNLSYVPTDERLRFVRNVYSLGFDSRWDLGFLSAAL